MDPRKKRDVEIVEFLEGEWKRNLEWREFGNVFQHLSSSNTIVSITRSKRVDADSGNRYLRWSFGQSMKPSEMDFLYEMKVSGAARSSDAYFEFVYAGTACHGRYFHVTGVIVLNMALPTSTVTTTYRILDDDTMAVCIVEVDSTHTPTIQFGNMHRIMKG
eukprot:TRINITY_DN75436_c0_g1_i1.p1 TRINITY_DN75436_c0_g1~~TRINITY_DN75436_c0_g1_i1.p1  ORF type:complete len:187 (+),score=31.33 TRINITY_DN75436_c0_g1_i1:79-561(+)